MTAFEMSMFAGCKQTGANGGSLSQLASKLVASGKLKVGDTFRIKCGKFSAPKADELTDTVKRVKGTKSGTETLYPSAKYTPVLTDKSTSSLGCIFSATLGVGGMLALEDISQSFILIGTILSDSPELNEKRTDNLTAKISSEIAKKLPAEGHGVEALFSVVQNDIKGTITTYIECSALVYVLTADAKPVEAFGDTKLLMPVQ
jgi:hypothetical protein